jgi:uncharacterized protein YyaL (SSP411 family)
MNEFAADTLVEWREWSADAFAVADRAGKPVLLALSAPWCLDCRQMDETTYSEPAIAANVNDGFVPVRVNVDRHPQVRDRYNMGGFPSTVFLTPEGSIITGATYLGVDGFREILDAVRRTWDGKGEAAGSVPRQLAEAEPPGGALSARVEEHMVEQLLAAYDDEYGGWGTDVKFPMARTVEFALVRARDQATRTLEAIRTRLRDTYDGGFFRFARNRDWSDPQREKLLDENAALVRAFAYGYRYTGEESYRETAEETVDYLTTDCWTGEAFAASQAGEDDYYHLEATEREAATPPYVDETVFAGRNALAADALMLLSAYTDNERARRYARRTLDYVTDELLEDGRVIHYREDGAAETGPVGLLASQARVLAGLTTAWSVTGDPGPARAVADAAIDDLQRDHGAFRDGPAVDLALLDRPLYPLDTTAQVAHGLLDLAALTGEARYRDRAREALAAFTSATDRMGVEMADYAAAVARARSPGAVAVGAPAGSDLHRAALRLADHETTVAPADDRATDGAAALLVDGERQGTADSPAELEALLTDEA